MDEHAQVAHQLRAVLGTIASVDPTTLPSEPRFQEGMMFLKDLKPLADAAATLPLVELPGWYVRDALTRAQSVYRTLEEARHALHPATHSHDREMQLRNFEGASHSIAEFSRSLLHAFGYLAFRAADLSSPTARAAKAAANLESLEGHWNGTRERHARYMDEMHDEAMSLIGKVRLASAEEGIAKHENTFSAEARKCLWWIWGWLIAGALCGISAMGLAIWVMLYHPPVGSLNEASAWQQLVTRIVIIGGPLVAAGICLRMCRAYSHVRVDNRHRANALETFRLFTLAAHGQDARDHVLKAASQTIYSPGITGFVDAGDEKANNEVVSLMQSLTGVVRRN